MAGKRSRVVHRTRPEVSSRLAVLVTVRIREGLPSLRKRETFGVLENAFVKGKERLGLRLLHFSVLSEPHALPGRGQGQGRLDLGHAGLVDSDRQGPESILGTQGKGVCRSLPFEFASNPSGDPKGPPVCAPERQEARAPDREGTESIPSPQDLGTWLGERNGAPGSAQWPRPGEAPDTSNGSCPSAWTNSQAQGTNSPSRSQYDLGQPTEEGFPGGHARGGHRGNEARVKRGRRCCRRVALYLAATPAPAFCPRRWRRWARHPEHIAGDPESPGQRQTPSAKRQTPNERRQSPPPSLPLLQHLALGPVHISEGLTRGSLLQGLARSDQVRGRPRRGGGASRRTPVVPGDERRVARLPSSDRGCGRAGV